MRLNTKIVVQPFLTHLIKDKDIIMCNCQHPDFTLFQGEFMPAEGFLTFYQAFRDVFHCVARIRMRSDPYPDPDPVSLSVIPEVLMRYIFSSLAAYSKVTFLPFSLPINCFNKTFFSFSSL